MLFVILGKLKLPVKKNRMNNMKIIPGIASPSLSLKIATALNLKLAKTTFREFPDGEIYVKVENFDDKNIIVQSLISNEDIVSLMMLFDALKGTEIITVIPYMGYARQDRAFEKGEAISIRAIAEFLEKYSSKILTVNLHSEKGASYFNKLINLDATPLIGNYLKEKDIVMISPDLGFCERVKVLAKIGNFKFYCLEKRRIDSKKVEILAKNLDIKGKKVVIVDDIIPTGETIIKAGKILLEKGAENITAVCVHPVLANYSLNDIYRAGIKEVIATDTIERSISKISVADLIANELRKLM